MDERQRKLLAGGGILAVIGGLLLTGKKAEAEEEEPGIEPTTFPCPYCDQVFDTLEALNLHINYDHPTTPPIPGEYIVYSNLWVSPSAINLGSSATVRVDVNNLGTDSSSVHVDVGNGLTKNVTVAGGETVRVTWTFKPTSVGYYTFAIGTDTKMLEVNEYEDPYQPPIEEDQTAMALHVPSGINWTFAHTGPGTFAYGVPPEQAYYVKYSGNRYRYADLNNVIDYWNDSEGLHWKRLAGSSTWFGMEGVYAPGNIKWYTYNAMFNYLDAGCPNGWYHEGIWESKAFACRDGASASWMCQYFPSV